MQSITRKMTATGLLSLGMILAPEGTSLFAQSGTATGTGGNSPTVGASTGTNTGSMGDGRTGDRRDNNDGFDLGWLGLAGLAGLAGLLPKKTHPVATTAHRTNDNLAR